MANQRLLVILLRLMSSIALVMESFVMGFALLLAMKDHTSNVIIIGAVISLLCLLTPGLLKKIAPTRNMDVTAKP